MDPEIKYRLSYILIVLLKFVFSPFTQNCCFKIKNGLGKGFKVMGGLGFLKAKYHLSEEERFLLNINLKEKVIYDIGGDIGIYAMFFSKYASYLAGIILCFCL